MVLIALSYQGEVEKYGAYVGIAAFFGLAVLSLLYFSHARELKRLREWADGAPERARELEQRAVAQAAARAARPSLPTQGGVAPPRRLAEMPGPPTGAAETAAGAQATEVAERVEGEEAATNGNKPGAPGAPAAIGANGTSPPAEGVETGESDAGAGPEGAEGEAAGDETDSEPQGSEAAEADGQAGEEADRAAAPQAVAEPEPEPDAAE